MSVFAAFDAVVGVAHSAIEGLAALLTPTVGGLAAAVAIVGFTVLVRLLVSPLSWLQARAAKRGAALAPRIAELREKHADDPMALASETLALQRANGAGPGMSLLPALVQAPFFMVMYRLVQPGSGQPHGLLSGDLFGVPLTAHVLGGLPVFAVLIALATALAIWTSRRARKSLAAATPVGTPSPADSRATKTGPRRSAGTRTSSTKRTAQDGSAAPKRATLKPAATKPAATKPAAGEPVGQDGSAAPKPVGRDRSAAPKPVGRKRSALTKPAARAGAAAKSGPVGRPGDSGPAGQSAVEAAGPLVGRLMTFMPYLTIVMVAYLPLAGALYLVTSTAWTALEQALWRRPAPSGNR